MVNKEKFTSVISSVSGITSLLGSWQICHNICLGIVTLLALIGITGLGMPLFFLTKVAIPFWTVAFIFFIITLIMYAKKKCISKNMLMLNSGLLIAGIPFQQLQDFTLLFWIIGGSLVGISIIILIKDKLKVMHEK